MFQIYQGTVQEQKGSSWTNVSGRPSTLTHTAPVEPELDVCADGVCCLPTGKKHSLEEMKYTQFPAHRGQAKRGFVYEDRIRDHLLGEEDTPVARSRVCEWYYLCANAYIHDRTLSKFSDGYLCERIGPIPLGIPCPACGGRVLARESATQPIAV